MSAKAKAPENLSRLQKALRRDQLWEKDELLDVVHWLRQGLALICGLIWGLFGIQGFAGLAGFLAFNALVVYLYHTKYLGVDDESIRNDVLTEGLMNSFGLFLVVWICAYSFILPSK